MLLLRIKPQERARLKGESAPAHNISDGSSHDEVQLKLNMMVAFEFGRVPGGFHKV
jgi:hypothetical protein